MTRTVWARRTQSRPHQHRSNPWRTKPTEKAVATTAALNTGMTAKADTKAATATIAADMGAATTMTAITAAIGNPMIMTAHVTAAKATIATIVEINTCKAD